MIDSPMWKESWEFYRSENEKKEGAAYAVDEHYYVAPEWLLSHADLYDSYQRDVGVFAGEYAAHVADRANSMEAALAEAPSPPQEVSQVVRRPAIPCPVSDSAVPLP
jgi:hypothetical protein